MGCTTLVVRPVYFLYHKTSQEKEPIMLQALKKRKERIKDAGFLLILIAPAAILLCFAIFIPILRSMYYSFFDYSLLRMSDPVFNGFQNFIDAFEDGDFIVSLRVTLTYVVSVVAIEFVLGMSLALLLNREFKGRKFVRSVVLIPWIVPTIVVALLWMWIFQADYGVLNYILVKLHILAENKKWVSEPDLALIAVMIAAMWRQLPFMATMLLAGMQGIPHDMIEAARIDGATKVQMFFRIILPFMKRIINTVTLVAIIENFKMFPMFWIMTGGGPMDRTTTLAILSYRTSFVELNLGKGAAIGVMWLIILVSISMIYNWLFRDKYEEVA